MIYVGRYILSSVHGCCVYSFKWIANIMYYVEIPHLCILSNNLINYDSFDLVIIKLEKINIQTTSMEDGEYSSTWSTEEPVVSVDLKFDTGSNIRLIMPNQYSFQS